MTVALQLPVEQDSALLVIPGVDAQTQANLVLSLLIVLLVFFVRRGVLALVAKNVDDGEVRYKWAKGSANVAFLIAALLLVQVWFTAISSVGTFLGLLSAGLAIALKDAVTDLAGWIFIVWRRPFELGDRIQIGPHSGDVVDKSLFQFTVMEIGNWVSADQSTGRLIHIPNAQVFSHPLANYEAGFPFLWNELQVLVTFESDWRKAKELLKDVATDFSVDLAKSPRPRPKGRHERFLIKDGKRTPIVYTTVEDSGVLLTLRYLCRPRERRGSASDLWERILTSFEAHDDVVLAYPTQRVNLAREGLADGGSSDG